MKFVFYLAQTAQVLREFFTAIADGELQHYLTVISDSRWEKLRTLSMYLWSGQICWLVFQAELERLPLSINPFVLLYQWQNLTFCRIAAALAALRQGDGIQYLDILSKGEYFTRGDLKQFLWVASKTTQTPMRVFRDEWDG